APNHAVDDTGRYLSVSDAAIIFKEHQAQSEIPSIEHINAKQEAWMDYWGKTESSGSQKHDWKSAFYAGFEAASKKREMVELPTWLIPSAIALIEMDRRNQIVPHGIGNHARDIIEAFIAAHKPKSKVGD